jgi:hypothetical protein
MRCAIGFLDELRWAGDKVYWKAFASAALNLKPVTKTAPSPPTGAALT